MGGKSLRPADERWPAPEMRRTVPCLAAAAAAEADVAAVPWVAALHHRRQHLCAGSIVGARFVLTSAQCAQRSSPGSLAVRVGSSLRGSGGQVCHAADITSHESYRPWSWDYDISVVRLDADIAFDNNKKAVSLATQEPAAGSTARVAGWGLQARGGVTSLKLRAATLHIFDREPCNAKYNVALSEVLLCAGAEGVDACVGDGGGPLVDTETKQQVGVVLWEHDCAQPRHYEQDFRMPYTSVAGLRSWIKNKTGI
ncbi:trypsin-4-like [Schistocerca gregaria]|uniref:trypsin-4-like n=1 Tax=Schistocerca gregaria TaxID=7010 RepID=UPI00211E4E0B|nr:trypsin-4-like [Schistocerca gregaria]